MPRAHRSEHPFRRDLRPKRPERAASPLVDCGSRTHGEPACGACDRCLYEQVHLRADHPAVLELEELARL